VIKLEIFIPLPKVHAAYVRLVAALEELESVHDVLPNTVDMIEIAAAMYEASLLLARVACQEAPDDEIH